MNITTKTFYGSNIYAREPIVLITIDKGSIPIAHIINTCKKVGNIFSEYIDEDIFKVIDSNVHFGKLIANFAFNIVNKNHGVIDSYGAKRDNQTILSWVEFDVIQVTIKAIELVIKIFISFLQNQNLEQNIIDKIFDDYSKFTKRYNSYSIGLLKASKDLDIPSFQYSTGSIYRQYGWGKNSRVLRLTSPMEDSYHGVSVSMDKDASKKLLKSIGMPVARDVIIHSKEQLLQAIKEIGYPCVVKPIRGKKGIGNTINILSFDELQDAFDYAKQSSFGNNPIMIERFIEGNPYRLMVVDGRVLASIQKVPPTIIGNGQSNIQNLIEDINNDRNNPLKNKNHLQPIKVNDELINYLKKFNLNFNSILENKREFTLNLTTHTYGMNGASINNTIAVTHPDIIKMAELIAKVTHIDVLGIDYITTDISKSFHKTKGAICEYNHLPGLSDLEIWSSDILTPLEFANIVIGQNVGRIPMYLIIIDNSKIEQIKSWFKNNIIDNKTGWYCDNEVYLGELDLSIYDKKGWEPIQILLRQKTLSKAFIVCSPEEIIEKGLPVDKFNTIHYKSIDNDWYKVLDNATSKLVQFTGQNQVFEFLEGELPKC